MGKSAGNADLARARRRSPDSQARKRPAPCPVSLAELYTALPKAPILNTEAMRHPASVNTVRIYC